MSGPLAPVRFDQQAAEEAARELLVTAESIIEALSVLSADRETVTEDWQGHFRDAFDSEIELTLASGAFMVDTLQQMATVVRARAFEAQAAHNAYELQERQRAEDDG